MMKRPFLYTVIVFCWISSAWGADVPEPFRAPAIPLITMDPYISCWSFSDNLFDQDTRHWTGHAHPMTGLLRVDRKVYRFMGAGSFETVVTNGQQQPFACRYTQDQPGPDWAMPYFDDSHWRRGVAPFGQGAFRGIVKTPWIQPRIWFRREFTCDDSMEARQYFVQIPHPEVGSASARDVEVYVNGVLAARIGRWNQSETVRLPEQAAMAIRGGTNVLAVSASARNRSRFMDIGLVKSSASTLVRQGPVRISATQTVYPFSCGPVELDVIFTSPLLMADMDLMSRPVSYISFEAIATDGKPHHTQIYFDAGPQWCVNTTDQPVTWEHTHSPLLNIMTVGSEQQAILQKAGDDLRIDWGHFYVAAENRWDISTAIAERSKTLARFHQTGGVKIADDTDMPRAVKDRPLALAVAMDLGMVRHIRARRHVTVGYDDLYSIDYFGTKLRPWWRRFKDMNMRKMLLMSETAYDRTIEASQRFDEELHQAAFASGGREYTQLCALAYRQAMAAHKLVAGPDNMPLYFSKENFSNGSIGTVDVTYPSSPLFLLYNPDLLKAMLEPIFFYTESGKWTKPFAAHDVGKYPQATGQQYKRDMPVEECGNMLILCGALTAVEKVPDFAARHWETLTQWARYLVDEGFDPQEQLCTDDFAGHLAHNANLSIKSILALACYGKMAGRLDDEKTARGYQSMARQMAMDWMEAARDGDHYSLTFDQKGTWSQKYNLVWDQVLDLNIFPKTVATQELAYYLDQQNAYGLPLDSRETYTKSDWIMWTATMASYQTEFAQFIHPVYLFAHHSPDRVPLSDWHYTTNAKVRGFRARSVVGGYFMKMLADKIMDN